MGSRDSVLFVSSTRFDSYTLLAYTRVCTLMAYHKWNSLKPRHLLGTYQITSVGISSGNCRTNSQAIRSSVI